MIQKKQSISGSLLVCVCAMMQAGKACVGFCYLLGNGMTTQQEQTVMYSSLMVLTVVFLFILDCFDSAFTKFEENRG